MPDKKYRAYHTEPFNTCKEYPLHMGEGQLRQILARCIYPPPLNTALRIHEVFRC